MEECRSVEPVVAGSSPVAPAKSYITHMAHIDPSRRLRKTDCTYVLCRDPSCKAFRAPGYEGFLCGRGKCPLESPLAIVCHHCRKTIVLPHDHFSWCRVDCPGCGAANFQRMSGEWRRSRDKNARSG